MSVSIIQDAIHVIAQDKRDLSMREALEAMTSIMRGEASHTQVAALLIALKMKDETPEEIAGMASAMMQGAVRVESISGLSLPLVDTAGTGGDGKNWFNISTAAAIVAAGSGALVAKHGNRSVTSSTGSADVLEALGVTIEGGSKSAAECLKKAGIFFMFAPEFHPGMKRVATVRREIGVPTVFNVLGPLVNPAKVKRQLIGASSRKVAEKLAQALTLLGTDYSLVINAESGADEIDVQGATLMYQVTASSLKRRRTRPADFGLPEGDRNHLSAMSAEESAAIIRDVLEGKGSEHNAPPSPERSAYISVVINAAAALTAAGIANSFQDGAEKAKQSITSGKAKEKLRLLVDASKYSS